MVGESEYITRPEYEARQSEMRAELIRLAGDVSQDRKDVQAKFEILTAKIDGSRVSMWKLVALSTINFMIGGSVGIFLNYIHIPR